MHVPVLLGEILSIMDRPGISTVVDGTVGGGGHAEAILEKFDGVGLYIGLDRDSEAVDRATARLKRFGDRVKIVKSHFADLDKALDEMNRPKVDAVMMDLGVSSFHLDDASRGFSFARAGRLDMRMDESQSFTAGELVNGWSEKQLSEIFFKFGEERYSRSIARAIVRERVKEPFEDTLRLAKVITSAQPRAKGRRGVNPATRVFQALRIAVNGELDRLKEGVEKGVERLNAGGIIAVISFHSLEDRIVKHTLVDLTQRCVCPKEAPMCVCGTPGKVTLITKKPIRPKDEEIERNPRARSARLRVAQRLAA